MNRKNACDVIKDKCCVMLASSNSGLDQDIATAMMLTKLFKGHSLSWNNCLTIIVSVMKAVLERLVSRLAKARHQHLANSRHIWLLWSWQRCQI